jgi:multiple sugar transport system permease protein
MAELEKAQLRNRMPGFFWMLLPSFLLISIFLFYPFFYQLYLSLFSTTLYHEGSFVGLANFLRVISDPTTLESLRITAVFIALSTTIELIWGLAIAMGLQRIIRGRRFLRGVVILPLMLTPVAVGSMWNFMYFPEGGAVSTLMRLLGRPPQVWLTQPDSALLAIVAVEVWQFVPFTALVLLAALQTIPADYYEVASMFGATKVQRFRYITLPCLRGSLLIVLLFNIMRQIKTFDIVYTVTRGGPGRATSVISFNIYQRGFRFYNISEAAALAFLVLIVVMIISNRIVKLVQRSE